MVTGVNRAFELLSGAGFVYGHSDAILSVNAMVGEISRTDIAVLLHGESGTGKDVYGRLIHQLSAMRELSLVKLSCTALRPEELLTRVKSSLEDFKAWSADPFAWERAVTDKAKVANTATATVLGYAAGVESGRCEIVQYDGSRSPERDE